MSEDPDLTGLRAKFRPQMTLMPTAAVITHGASEASGVRNFWHLSAKILYTVEPKNSHKVPKARLNVRRKNQ